MEYWEYSGVECCHLPGRAIPCYYYLHQHHPSSSITDTITTTIHHYHTARKMGLTYAHRDFSPSPTNRTPLVPAAVTNATSTPAFIIRLPSNPHDGRFAIQLPYVLGTERVVVVGEVEEVEEGGMA